MLSLNHYIDIQLLRVIISIIIFGGLASDSIKFLSSVFIYYWHKLKASFDLLFQLCYQLGPFSSEQMLAFEIVAKPFLIQSILSQPAGQIISPPLIYCNFM